MEKLLLKPSEVAELTGWGRTKVYELIQRREIPSVRLGGALRVPLDELRKHIRAAQVRVGDDAPLGSAAGAETLQRADRT